PVTRDTLLARLRDHIQTVVGRFRGRIRGWDVVNEALNEDGTLRPTPWLTSIGEDYLAKAFRFANEAEPDAELYYNDYGLENAPKRRGALELVRRRRAEGVPVTGVGLQGHNRMDWPTPAQQDTTIAAFAALGVRVMITELDIDVLPRRDRPAADSGLPTGAPSDLNPYRDSLPDSVQRALAQRTAFARELKQSLSDRLARRIRGMIQRGQYRVGDRLPAIMEMAKRFGVGHPTVREALKKLETIGVVEIRHGSGVYVSRSEEVLV